MKQKLLAVLALTLPLLFSTVGCNKVEESTELEDCASNYYKVGAYGFYYGNSLYDGDSLKASFTIANFSSAEPIEFKINTFKSDSGEASKMEVYNKSEDKWEQKGLITIKNKESYTIRLTFVGSSSATLTYGSNDIARYSSSQVTMLDYFEKYSHC